MTNDDDAMIRATQCAITSFAMNTGASFESAVMQLTANLLIIMLRDVGEEKFRNRIEYVLKSEAALVREVN